MSPIVSFSVRYCPAWPFLGNSFGREEAEEEPDAGRGEWEEVDMAEEDEEEAAARLERRQGCRLRVSAVGWWGEMWRRMVEARCMAGGRATPLRRVRRCSRAVLGQSHGGRGGSHCSLGERVDGW